jgi:large subunit ribosomal protein L4
VAILKKYNIEGKETGTTEVDDAWLDVKANGQMIKDYIVALRENARQWSANTKDRSEVKCSTKKPHKQKGLGRARQGSLVAPQFRGGGIVFGPKPKFDQHVRINKKERNKVTKFLVAEMIKEQRVTIIEDIILEAPKTKTVAAFIKNSELKGKRILFLGEGSQTEIPGEYGGGNVDVYNDRYQNFSKSVNNIPKMTFSLAKNISGYDVMVAHDIVMTEAALEEIKDWLK